MLYRRANCLYRHAGVLTLRIAKVTTNPEAAHIQLGQASLPFQAVQNPLTGLEPSCNPAPDPDPDPEDHA